MRSPEPCRPELLRAFAGNQFKKSSSIPRHRPPDEEWHVSFFPQSALFLIASFLLPPGESPFAHEIGDFLHSSSRQLAASSFRSRRQRNLPRSNVAQRVPRIFRPPCSFKKFLSNISAHGMDRYIFRPRVQISLARQLSRENIGCSSPR